MYKIPVSRPSLPNFDKYVDGLKVIWKSRYLSNFSYYANKYEDLCQKYLGVKHARVLGNADIGLILGLSILDLKPTSEIILPSFTFNSTANAVRWNNLKPIFADIDENSWCIDPKDVEKKITKNTKVVLATHVFGNPCRVKELRAICDRYDLTLMFDSAHGYGSLYEGKKIGTLGDIEVFSFSGTKVVTSAEGGLITMNKEDLYDKMTLARNYGFVGDYNSVRNGVNGKISEMNALMGCLNLIKIEKQIARRQKIAEKYRKELEGVGDIDFQKIDNKDRSAFKDFAITTSFRDELATKLEDEGIQTKKYFRPIHLMDWYSGGESLPVTEYITGRCLCLPIFNDITTLEQNKVIGVIKNFFIKK